MKKIHVIRVLVSYSKTNYFLSGDRPAGFEHEMFRHPVRQHLKTYSLKFTVTIRFPPIPPVLELT